MILNIYMILKFVYVWFDLNLVIKMYIENGVCFSFLDSI